LAGKKKNWEHGKIALQARTVTATPLLLLLMLELTEMDRVVVRFQAIHQYWRAAARPQPHHVADAASPSN
jgi:hypothetical protein